MLWESSWFHENFFPIIFEGDVFDIECKGCEMNYFSFFYSKDTAEPFTASIQLRRSITLIYVFKNRLNEKESYYWLRVVPWLSYSAFGGGFSVRQIVPEDPRGAKLRIEPSDSETGPRVVLE